MTSSTLNGSIYSETSSTHDGTSGTNDGASSARKAKKIQFQTDLLIEGGNEKGSDNRNGRYIVPGHVFNILFLGGPGVGKSRIINKVSRASPFPNIR
jgi:hypothetical protein